MEMEATVSASKSIRKRVVPSDSDQVRIVAKYDLLRHLRSRRLIGVLVIEAVILALLASIPILTGTPYPTEFIKAVGNFVGQAGGIVSVNTLIIIGAALFAADSISSEFQNRTGYLLFPNPIKRWVLLAGKFVAAMTVMVLVVVIYYVVAFIVAGVVAKDFSHAELAIGSMLLALLFSMSAVSVGMFLSSLLKGSVGAIVLTFFLLLLILPIIDGIFSFVQGFSPVFSVTFASQSISLILTTPYPMDSVTRIPTDNTTAITLYTHVPDVALSVVVMLLYAAILMSLAYFLFQRREMTG